MRKIQATFVLSMMLIVSACSMDTSNKHQDAMDLATAWVTAYLTSKDSALSMIDNNMASDGVSVGERYVGFGFVWNPDGDGMVVDYVVPDSPADGVLEEGDDIVQVNGILLTKTCASPGSLAKSSATERGTLLHSRNTAM